jgi:hypothetical protein
MIIVKLLLAEIIGCGVGKLSKQIQADAPRVRAKHLI